MANWEVLFYAVAVWEERRNERTVGPCGGFRTEDVRLKPRRRVYTEFKQDSERPQQRSTDRRPLIARSSRKHNKRLIITVCTYVEAARTFKPTVPGYF